MFTVTEKVFNWTHSICFKQSWRILWQQIPEINENIEMVWCDPRCIALPWHRTTQQTGSATTVTHFTFTTEPCIQLHHHHQFWRPAIWRQRVWMNDLHCPWYFVTSITPLNVHPIDFMSSFILSIYHIRVTKWPLLVRPYQGSNILQYEVQPGEQETGSLVNLVCER